MAPTHARRVERSRAVPRHARRVSGPLRPVRAEHAAAAATAAGAVRAGDATATGAIRAGDLAYGGVAVPGGRRPRQRTSAFERLRALPDTRLVDRLLRGRACIWLIGILLGGIVAMQVSLLKLNSGISRAVETAGTLERENADMQAEISRLASGERVRAAAVQLGMIDPPAGDVRFLRARPRYDGALAAMRMQPPSAEAKAVMANGGRLPGLTLTSPAAALTSGASSTMASGTASATTAATTTPTSTASPTAAPSTTGVGATTAPTSAPTAPPATTPAAPATTTSATVAPATATAPTSSTAPATTTSGATTTTPEG